MTMASQAAAAAFRARLLGASCRSPTRSAATAAAAHPAEGAGAGRKPVGDYVPVYVALGMIALSVSLGLGTARQQLAHAPNVWVDKKKREAVPEVAAPDVALGDAERFVGGSLFRKVAQVQDDRALLGAAAVADPVSDYTARKAVTLKDAGVEPPGIERSREEAVGDLLKKKKGKDGGA